MSDIFISYARDDRFKVEPLAKALEAKGWSVWWDARIRAGEAFDRLLEKALAEARCVVVVWSNNSVESDWVRAEAGDGLERGILISIAIEDTVRLPLRFRNIHTEQLIDWDGKSPSPAFDKLVGDLEGVLGHPEAPENPSDKEEEHPDLDAMVEVPAGEFIYQDGKVIIETPFMIDVYPVTNQQYKKFIRKGCYQDEQLWSIAGQAWLNAEKATEPSYWYDDKFNQPEHPVVGVNYYEAEAFAKYAGKRLPTEKEWERAARGTDGRKYPWGNEFDKNKSNTYQSEIGKTTPVTRYSNGISPVGCYDMVGNVSEWTNSWYHPEKSQRVLRGGSWFSDQFSVRCAGRSRSDRDDRSFDIGFRCARNIK